MKSMFALISTVFAACTALAATVKDIAVTTHYPWNDRVNVSYSVSGVEAGSDYDVTATLTAGSLAPIRQTANITADGTYTFEFTGTDYVGRTDDAKVTIDLAKPSYCVVDLANNYAVSYISSATSTAGDDYKTTKLLLRSDGTTYMGVYEITQKQMSYVLATCTSYFSQNADTELEGKRPADRVTAQEAKTFIETVNAKTGLNLRLPTYDEWLKAVKADETSRTGLYIKSVKSDGASSTTYLNAIARYDAADYAKETSDAKRGTAVVGTYEPQNGIYDLIGNVAERVVLNADDDIAKTTLLAGGAYWHTKNQIDAFIASDTAWDTADKNMAQSEYAQGMRLATPDTAATAKPQAGSADKTFTYDVATEARKVTVTDNAGTYTFKYLPQGASTQIDWVAFDDDATVGGKNWKPTAAGDNTAICLSSGETAVFTVTPLAVELTAAPVTAEYDEKTHTITGPTLTAPVNGTIVYWCTDKAGQASENEAAADKPVFTEVKYDANGDVAPYYIWYKVTSPFYTTKTECQALTITPKSLAAATINLGAKLSYTGAVRTQNLASVTLSGISYDLVADRDYTLSGNTGTDAKGYTLTITGKGNFKDTATATWEIAPQDISAGGPSSGSVSAFTINCSDYDKNGITYNGQEQELKIDSVSATIGGTAVAVTYEILSGNKATEASAKAGTYTVTVKGTGNFQGTVTREWEIQQLDITGAAVTLTGSLTYNGDEQTREVKTVVKDGLTVPAADYANGITGNTGKKAGKYTMTVKITDAASNFKGYCTKDWSIAKKALADTMFTLTPDAVTYKAAAFTKDDIAITASDKSPKGVEAIADTDWTATYPDTKDVGTATVTIKATADGNYCDPNPAVTKAFTITPATIKSLAIARSEFTWTGNNIEIQMADATVKSSNDLTLTAADFYLVDKKATDTGKYTAKAKAKTGGNFQDPDPITATAEWQIIPAAPKVHWAGMKGAESSAGTATDNDGFKVCYFYKTDLTVAGDARCPATESLTWSLETLDENGVWTPATIQIADDKFHVTARTRVTVYATTTKDGLVGKPTQVEFVPGKCADLVITPKSFEHSNTAVVFTDDQVTDGNYKVDGKELGVTPTYEPRGVEGSVWYSVRDKDDTDKVIVDWTDSTATPLTVNADVTVLAQTRDQQYVWSNIATQKIERAITPLAAPVVTVVTNDLNNYTISVDKKDGIAYFYTTAITNVLTGEGSAAINPVGKYEQILDQDGNAQPGDAEEYKSPVEVTLEKDQLFEVKVVGYAVCNEHTDCFTDRTAVADQQIFRGWTIGDAMDYIKDELENPFQNGKSQVPDFEADPVTNKLDRGFMVTNDTTAVGGECMRSGSLADGDLTTSSLTKIVDGPGMVVFNWKSYCEDDPTGTAWDHGEFVIDGVITNRIDGVTDWATVTNVVDNSGSHTLTWTYVKDFVKQGQTPIPAGEDCLLVDAFVWTPANTLTEDMITLTKSPYTYNGSEQNPTNGSDYVVTATDPLTGKATNLVEGVDFTATADSHTDVGEYDITFTALPGSTLVTGAATTQWKIDPLSIANATATYQAEYTYDGTEQKPEKQNIIVKVPGAAADGSDLDVTSTSDWSVNYTETEHKKADTYSFTLSGNTNLKDTTTTSFSWTIAQRDIANVTISQPDNRTYNGTEYKPGVTVTDGDPSIITTDDYEVTYADDKGGTDFINVGTKVITVSPKGNYTGTARTVDYRVTTRNIGSSTITPTYTEVTYKAAAYENKFTVTSDIAGTPTLDEDYDFEVSGDSITQTDAGTYTTTINGKGNYSGTKSFSWTIKPIDMTTATVVVDPADISFTFDGKEHKASDATITKVTVNGLELKNYTIGSDSKSDAGSYTYSITSTDSNFSGTKEGFAWSIKPLDISTATATPDTEAFTWNGKAKWATIGTETTREITAEPTAQTNTFTVTITPAGGSQLSLELDKDYTVTYEGDGAAAQTDAGTYTTTITGKGNYTNSCTSASWKVKPTKAYIWPNKLDNPAEREIIDIPAGGVRVAVGRDSNDFGLCWKKTTVKDGVTTEDNLSNRSKKAFSAFQVKERTIVEVWTYTKSDNTESDHIWVEYKMGFTATPVCVLQNMADGTLPVDEMGNAITNSVGLQIPTNFYYNAQRVILTRGNIDSNNVVIAGTETNTNYIDGVLAYTLNGTEPVYSVTNGVAGEGTYVWDPVTSVIEPTNTVTIIARVFGDQYFDSALITNTFVRLRNEFTAPAMAYTNADVTVFADVTTDTVDLNAVPTYVKLTRTDDHTEFGSIYYQIGDNGTPTQYTDLIQLDASAKVSAWIEDPNGECTAVTNTVTFNCDTQLAEPTTAFNKDTKALADYQIDETSFKNVKQVIDLKRENTTFTKDTDGELRYSTDQGATWTTGSQLTIWGTTEVWAQAVNSTKGLADSTTNIVTYTQSPDTLTKPSIVKGMTATVKQLMVTITREAGTIVYYSTDGSDPIGPNETAVTSDYFTETSKDIVLDIKEGEEKTVKAIAYTLDANGDFFARSETTTYTYVRESSIGDALRGGAEEEPGSSPSTADMVATSNAKDGQNCLWTDDSTPPVTNDTSWVVDTTVAYNGGDKSMRSGAVRDAQLDRYGNIIPNAHNGTNSVMTAQVQGPGLFTFYWKASTEFGSEVQGDDYYEDIFDYCEVLLDGEPLFDADDNQIITWGTNDWEKVVIKIEDTNEVEQTHTITWNYTKDEEDYDDVDLFGEDDEGNPLGHVEDCVWVDDVVWTPAPKLENATVTVDALTYSQQDQSPTFNVEVNGVPLTNGVDYVAEFTPQTAAGTYDYTLKATGKDYTGTISGTWTIDPLDISTGTVMLEADTLVYSGSEQSPVVTNLVVNGLNLTAAEGYDVTDNTGTDAGDYELTVTGKLNLTNTVKKAWYIAAHPIEGAEVKMTEGLVYNQKEQTCPVVSVTVSGLTLVEDYDFEVTGNVGTNAGPYTATIKGKGNFSSKITADWSIAKRVIDQTTRPTPSVWTFTYDGDEHTASNVTALTFSDGVVITDASNWTYGRVTAATHAGKYAISINGTKNLEGSRSSTWNILQKPLEQAMGSLSYTTTAYNGKEQKPGVKVEDGTILTQADDCEISWPSADYVNVGTKTVTISGKTTGNYSGNFDLTYEITQAAIDTFELNETGFTYDRKEKTVTVKVVKANGVELKSSEYTLTGDKGTEAGTYTATVTAAKDSNFTGSKTATWTISPCDISGATIEAEEPIYSGKEEQLKITSVTKGGLTLASGTEYYVTNSTDKATNVVDAAGTTIVNTLEIYGTSNFTGKATLEWSVKPLDIGDSSTKLMMKYPYGAYPAYNGSEIANDITNVVVKTHPEYPELTFSDKSIGWTNGYDVVAKNAGDYRIWACGIGNLTGVRKTGWKINPLSITNAVVTLDQSAFTYNKSAQGPTAITDIYVPNAAADGSDLVITADYTTELESMTRIDAGDYTITVSGSDNFKDSVEVPWTIAPLTITNAVVTLDHDAFVWDNTEKAVSATKIETTNGIDVVDCSTITTSGNKRTEAGEYTATFEGSVNLVDSCTATWKIAPTAPAIWALQKDGTYLKVEKYSFTTAYIKVRVTSDDAADQDWTMWYTVQDKDGNYILGTTEAGKQYDAANPEGQKFDVTNRCTVTAWTLSNDRKVKSALTVAEFYNGNDIAPTIALVAETGRPVDTKDAVTVDAYAGNLLKDKTADAPATNFWHSSMKVCLSRTGFMTNSVAEKLIKETTVNGHNPYEDGEIWYTLDGSMPTNVASAVCFKYDPAAMITISSNATIVAQVFGSELANSEVVSNTFNRMVATVPTPTLDPYEADFSHTQTVKVTKGDFTNEIDWDMTTNNVTLYYSVNGGEKKEVERVADGYSFEVSYTDADENSEVGVEVWGEFNEDHTTSEPATGTYTWKQLQLVAPVVKLDRTDSVDNTLSLGDDEFAHENNKWSITMGAAVAGEPDLTNWDKGTVYYTTDGSDPLTSDTRVEYDGKKHTLANSDLTIKVAFESGTDEYASSSVTERDFTFKPFAMTGLTIDQASQSFTSTSFDVTFTRDAAKQGDCTHVTEGADEGDMKYSLDGGTTVLTYQTGNTITLDKTTTVMTWVDPIDDWHVASVTNTATFTRIIPAPTVELIGQTGDVTPDGKGTGGTFKHVADLTVTKPDGAEAQVSFDNGVTFTTYTAAIPMTNTFTVVAQSYISTPQQIYSVPVTQTWTRVWETIRKPALNLEDSADDPATNKGKTYNHSHETVLATADVEDTENVLWTAAETHGSPVTVTLYTNEVSEATEVGTYKQGTNFLQADTVALYGVATADDYLPATNSYTFVRDIRNLATKPTIRFTKQADRRSVKVTFQGHNGNAVYYTCATNAVPEDPIGTEYGLVPASTKATGTFSVILPMVPGQTITVKAIAYTEDGTNDVKHLMSGACFTARSKVFENSYELVETIGDVLEAPKQTFTVSDATKCFETDADYSTEGDFGELESHSSMEFSGLANSESVTLSTTVTGTGTVTFDWKTLCEKSVSGLYNRDHITFYVNGVAKAKRDGTNDWETVTVRIDGSNELTYKLSWVFEKDESESYVGDAAFVDHFTWTAEELPLALDTTGLASWITTLDDTVNVNDKTEVSTFLNQDAANGYKYWECFVTGLSVTDPDDKLTIDFPTAGVYNPYNGAVTISWNVAMKGRTYSLLAKKTLGDAVWTTLTSVDWTDGDIHWNDSMDESLKPSLSKDNVWDNYQFFQLKVEMTK